MKMRAPRIILKTGLIHDAVSIVLVCHKRLILIYIHEHGKRVETLQVRIFAVSQLKFLPRNFEPGPCIVLRFGRQVEVYIHKQSVSWLSLYSKFNFRDIDSDN